jgi:hypothetical protein
LVLPLVAACVAACRAEQPTAPDPGPVPARGAAAADAAKAPGTADRAPSIDPATAAVADPPAAADGGLGSRLDHLTRARIKRARPISKRSLSLRLTLEGGAAAVFKPIRREDRTARHEVAAFRLSRLLGLDGVPPSVMRRIPLDNFAWLLGDEHAETNEALREEAHLDERSGVWGATIAWIDGLEASMLDERGGRKELWRLLALDGPAVEQEPLVAEVSAMVVFDYVSGNWDRFSGGNLFLASGGGRLVLIDNNGAFSRWSATKQQRMDELLGLAFRFSNRLIDTLRSLHRSDLERALLEDRWEQTRRLLTGRELALLLERRDAVIARVDRLIADHGEEQVLAFP